MRVWTVRRAVAVIVVYDALHNIVIINGKGRKRTDICVFNYIIYGTVFNETSSKHLSASERAYIKYLSRTPYIPLAIYTRTRNGSRGREQYAGARVTRVGR